MIIDSHLHIDLRGYTEQKLLDHLSKNKIDKAWLLSWEEENPQLRNYSPVSGSRILEICSKYPDKFIPFYAPDPAREDLVERLRVLNNNGFRGVGELKVAMFWEDEAIERLLRGMKHRVLVFHMQDSRYYSSSLSVRQKILRDYRNERFSGMMKRIIEGSLSSGLFGDEEKKLKYFPGYLPDFKGLENRLSAFRNINFIAHGWLFWSSIDANYCKYRNLDRGKIKSKGIIWDLLEKHPNLYCDISAGSGWNALTRDRKTAREFLERFHEKILFGTDNSGLDFAGLVRSFKLPAKMEQAIFFGNSEKLLQ